MPQEVPDATYDLSLGGETSLRRVDYVRHEFPGRTSKRQDSLLVMVYDIPYLGACGVFPPLHLLNQVLLSGGSQSGMSPGTTWQPFSLSEREYQDLVAAVRSVAPNVLRGRARYADIPYTFDPSFDRHQDYFDWMRDVCVRHRAAWHAAMKRGGLP
jgi:hypothetical protein